MDTSTKCPVPEVMTLRKRQGRIFAEFSGMQPICLCIPDGAGKHTGNRHRKPGNNGGQLIGPLIRASDKIPGLPVRIPITG